MDHEKFIALVRERPSLWDSREHKYHMSNVQRKLWQEVSEEMKLSVETLKKTWRGLRDNFRKLYKKQLRLTNKSSLPVWPFYSQLLFLVDTITDMKISVPLNSDPLEEDDVDDSFLEDHQSNSQSISDVETLHFKERDRSLERDDDYQFLMSLLPSLHDIPRNRKLLVRSKIMEVLLHEMETQQASTSTATSFSSDSNHFHHKLEL